MAKGRRSAGETEGQVSRLRWSGISNRGHEVALRLAGSVEGQRLRDSLSNQFQVNYSRPMPYGMPLVWRTAVAGRVANLVSSAHLLVERIVELYPTHPDIQSVISLPPSLHADALDSKAAGMQRTVVDLCRMDFLLTPDGAPMLLEVNANCPGGVINAGESSRQWRLALGRMADEALPTQPFEEDDWLARGLIQAYRSAGLPTERAAVAFDRSGWRHEVTDIAQSFRRQGVATVEVDPRDIEDNFSLLGERSIGYQKISIQRMIELSTQAPRYFHELRTGQFNVQNGHAARFIADNKLCLAVLSDPAFAQYFDASIYGRVQPHIPWSRNAARCSREEMQTILQHPERYVLKHPLNTRGVGVIVGRSVGSSWVAAMARARAEHWLVQDFVETRRIERWPGEALMSHDISTFCLAGRFVGAFSRGGPDQKTNVGQGGYTHPVVIAPKEWD